MAGELSFPAEELANESFIPDTACKRLGKKPPIAGPKALFLSMFAQAPDGPELAIPPVSDFWKRRAEFPLRTYGNRTNGCCTRASQAMFATRMERIETRRTINIDDAELLRVYYAMTARLYGGGDTGAYESDALDEWRRPDLTFRDAKGRPYTIDAYVRVNPANRRELMQAIHASGAKGIKICFALPAAWAAADPPAVWDAPPDGRFVGEWQPNTWGGHSMYADAYSAAGIRVVHTWYESGDLNADEQIVTWAAVAAYSDEAYLVIDSIDEWRRAPNVSAAGVNVPAIAAAVNAVSSVKAEA